MFYIWRRIFKYHWFVKYALAPIYAFFGLMIWINLGILLFLSFTANSQSIVFCFGYIMACFITLIPASLIEPRYFLIPYIFYRLHISSKTEEGTRSKERNYKLDWLEPLLFLVADIILGYIFLALPFTWESEPGKKQRFMW